MEGLTYATWTDKLNDSIYWMITTIPGAGFPTGKEVLRDRVLQLIYLADLVMRVQIIGAPIELSKD